MINILWRNMPEKVFELMTDKQNELKKLKKRCISHGEALAALIKDKYDIEGKKAVTPGVKK